MLVGLVCEWVGVNAWDCLYVSLSMSARWCVCVLILMWPSSSLFLSVAPQDVECYFVWDVDELCDVEGNIHIFKTF